MLQRHQLVFQLNHVEPVVYQTALALLLLNDQAHLQGMDFDIDQPDPLLVALGTGEDHSLK